MGGGGTPATLVSMKPPVLLPPEELTALLDQVVLLDARQGDALYAEGHLRGARQADLNRDLSTADTVGFNPALGGRHPLPEVLTFARTVGAWGIQPGTRVVVYDAAGGANAAARCWWMLRSLGHTQVQVLDGGLQAALALGLKLSIEKPEFTPFEPYPAPHWQWTTVDIQVVEKLAPHASWEILDVRSPERYQGYSEPFDPIPGHIPGAFNLPYTTNLQEDGRFRPQEELKEMYEDLLGDLKPDHLVVHCGSGVTACHTLLALEHAGLPGASLYVGSWSQWCRSGKPIATGEQP